MKKILNHIKSRLVYIAAGAAIGFASLIPEFLKPFEQPAETSGLREDFAKTTLGRELLNFADNNKITISYGNGAMKDSTASGEYHHSSNHALVDSTLSMTDQIVCLAHELWHARQDIFYDYEGLEEKTMMSPKDRWSLRQYLESDAAAFSCYFWADRMVELEQFWPFDTERIQDRDIALKLRREMESDGLTLDEYREIAFETCIASRDYYKERHLDLADDQMPALCDAAENHIHFNKAARQLRAAPDSAEFEILLRKMGGIIIDENAPTSLSDTAVVSSCEILNEYPFRTFDTTIPGTIPFYSIKPQKVTPPDEILAAQTAQYITYRAQILGPGR